MDNFKGKSAFITGGASGIGLAIAKELLEAGAKVTIADIRSEALDRAAKALGANPSLKTTQLDVTDRKACLKAAEGAGRTDLLIANAGVFVSGPTQDATFDDWDFCLGINLGGTVNIVRAFVPRMVAAKAGGHVVLTSSINGLFNSGGAGVYTSSKFAVTGLGECLRTNLKPHGIGVSILCPGPVRTGLFESTPQVRPAGKDYKAYLVQLDESDPVSQEIFATAMSSEEVARKVMQGIRRNDLYIITHAEIRATIEARCKALLAALPAETIPSGRQKGAETLYTSDDYREQSAKPSPASV